MVSSTELGARERHAPLLAACEEQLAVLDALDPSSPAMASAFIATFDPVVDAIEVSDVSQWPPAADEILSKWAEIFGVYEGLVESCPPTEDEFEGVMRGFIARARKVLISLYWELGGTNLNPLTALAASARAHPRTVLVLRKWKRMGYTTSLSPPRVEARPRQRRTAARRAAGIRSGQDPGEGDDDPEGEPLAGASPGAGYQAAQTPGSRARVAIPAGGRS